MDLEKYFDTKSIKGRYQTAIAPDVAKVLTDFCKQEKEFEQAVEQSGKTFQECLDDTVKGIKQSCSDIEVYSKVVKFYFSTAEIRLHMTLDLIGKAGTDTQPESDDFSALLDSLLNF